MSKIRFASMITLFITIAILFVAGCGEKKNEDAQTGDEPNTNMSDTSMSETSSDPSSIEDSVANIPDLTGTWTGKFDSRTTTLKITEQDSVSFKGSITINYREVINQQVSGVIDVEKNTFTMNDLLHHRFAGSYSGKFSEDSNTLDGSFTEKASKRNAQFNLKRQ